MSDLEDRGADDEGRSNDISGTRELSVEKIIQRLARGDDLTLEQLELVRSQVARYLKRQGFRMDIHDVTDEAIAKFVRAVSQKRVKVETARGYLITIAHRVAIDRFRAQRELSVASLEEMPHSDDDVASLIDRSASASVVELALTHAVERCDTTCTRVINEWLNLAEQEERAPSNRQIAVRLNLSHSTVNDAIQRFRRYLEDVQASD